MRKIITKHVRRIWIKDMGKGVERNRIKIENKNKDRDAHYLSNSKIFSDTGI